MRKREGAGPVPKSRQLSRFGHLPIERPIEHRGPPELNCSATPLFARSTYAESRCCGVCQLDPARRAREQQHAQVRSQSVDRSTYIRWVDQQRACCSKKTAGFDHTHENPYRVIVGRTLGPVRLLLLRLSHYCCAAVAHSWQVSEVLLMTVYCSTEGLPSEMAPYERNT